MFEKKEKEEVPKEKAKAKAPVKKEVKVPKSTEAIVLGLGEDPVIEVGGEKFKVKEVRGLELVLVRKDVK